ncbi:MAG: hypothetical protein BroJett003_01630 [Planctomycetota bacterium]|nr:MAG: hypothetical protein BroJett003_01630 [Planctomycetota bacterium]
MTHRTYRRLTGRAVTAAAVALLATAHFSAHAAGGQPPCLLNPLGLNCPSGTFGSNPSGGTPAPLENKVTAACYSPMPGTYLGPLTAPATTEQYCNECWTKYGEIVPEVTDSVTVTVFVNALPYQSFTCPRP